MSFVLGMVVGAALLWLCTWARSVPHHDGGGHRFLEQVDRDPADRHGNEAVEARQREAEVLDFIRRGRLEALRQTAGEFEEFDRRHRQEPLGALDAPGEFLDICRRKRAANRAMFELAKAIYGATITRRVVEREFGKTA